MTESNDSIALSPESESIAERSDETNESLPLKLLDLLKEEHMEFLSRTYDSFWDESNWFPPGVNWTTLTSTETEKYPEFHDLKRPIYYAFLVLAVRAAFEWTIARPLGRAFGIKDTRSELPNIVKFVHQCCGRLLPIVNKYTDAGIEPNNVSKRFVRCKSVSKLIRKSTLDKFAESCWRFVYYFGIFFYGLAVLWNKPWFSTSTTHCWYGYPFQPISSDIYWYYMIELSFYWSLIFSQFVDVHRKDFWVNFIHHIATVLLMSFSWADNFVRGGTLVLLTHDAVDFWMEGAKMARYCKRNHMCNVLFLIFTVIWFITRCFYYPFWILYSTLIEAPALIGFYSAYYVFNFLLLLLQVLHIFWSVMILKIVMTAMKSGEADDARSDDEDEKSEELTSNYDVTDTNGYVPNGKAKLN